MRMNLRIRQFSKEIKKDHHRETLITDRKKIHKHQWNGEWAVRCGVYSTGTQPALPSLVTSQKDIILSPWKYKSFSS